MRSVCRETGFEAVMRIRCSAGFKVPPLHPLSVDPLPPEPVNGRRIQDWMERCLGCINGYLVFVPNLSTCLTTPSLSFALTNSSRCLFAGACLLACCLLVCRFMCILLVPRVTIFCFLKAPMSPHGNSSFLPALVSIVVFTPYLGIPHPYFSMRSCFSIQVFQIQLYP